MDGWMFAKQNQIRAAWFSLKSDSVDSSTKGEVREILKRELPVNRNLSVLINDHSVSQLFN